MAPESRLSGRGAVAEFSRRLEGHAQFAGGVYDDAKAQPSTVNLALFDFDGTVTTGDGFMPFVRRATPRARVIAGTLYLTPMAFGYRRGWVTPTRLRQSVARIAFRGRPYADVAAHGARYAAEVIPQRTRPEALERIRWHQQQGDEVVVVSASLSAYLEPWCREQGLHLLCTELETRDGICTGRYRGRDCTGEEKARRVRERFDLSRCRVTFAYGDTAEDRPMLALAQRRYFRWRELEGPGFGSLPWHPEQ
jgi:phosphatidylglycerophosphatase C